jgi:protein-tyrosine phosphatase
MDDGSRSSDMSLEMLHRMSGYGTDIVAATSHYYRRRESIDSFLDRRAYSFERLSRKLDADCPEILLGSETAFFFGIEEEESIDRLCIEGTRTLLLEMPFSPWTDYELNAVASLCFDRKLVVVLAHLERFVEFQKGSDILERMLKLPVAVQINAETVLPLLRRGQWIKMFAERKAHVLATDSHNLTDRAPNLGEAREMIRKKAGEETLRWIDSCTGELLGMAPAETE